MKILRKSVLGSRARSGASQLSVFTSYISFLCLAFPHNNQKWVLGNSMLMLFTLFKSAGVCGSVFLSVQHQCFTKSFRHQSPIFQKRGSITYPIPEFSKSIFNRTCATCGHKMQNVSYKITYSHTYLHASTIGRMCTQSSDMPNLSGMLCLHISSILQSNQDDDSSWRQTSRFLHK